MRHELGISPTILLFESLKEIISTLEESVDYHEHMIERYRDRLGLLLRHTGSGGDQYMPEITAGVDSSSLGGLKEDQQAGTSGSAVGSRKSGSRRRENEEQGWIVVEYEDYSMKVANNTQGNSAQSEISVLFKIVEALNAKLAGLKTAIKLIGELPSRGLKTDQRFLVVFRDGLPKQVIPTNESYANQEKFHYKDEFELHALKHV